MRLLAVVQRYGPEVPGGAEALCRSLAERMAARGHEVSVLTSCAVDYATWQDEYPAGESVEEGVHVLRLAVPRPRDQIRFGPLSARVIARPGVAPVAQQAWLAEEGPTIPDLGDALRASASPRHDAVAFFTYLYPPTVDGVPIVSSMRPTIVHPTADDEAPIRIPILRRTFDHADALAFSTPEERRYVRRRFRPRGVDDVLGIGFDPLDAPPDPAPFRRAHDLGDRPFLLYLGRIDPNKGADEAIEFVREYRRRRRSDLSLVMVGAPAMEIPEGDGVIVAGFVPDAMRWSALAGCTALVQPSYQESFSMALAEAWLARRPALVQGHCDVLDGLARRAGGALPFHDFPEFEAALDLLLERPELQATLGERGHAHVVEQFSWDHVLDRYETLIDRSRARWADRRDQSLGLRATTA